MFAFVDTKLESQMVEYVEKQLEEDKKNMEAGKPISLLAKWMPSINTSSQATRDHAKWFMSVMDIDACIYRKMLSKLRSHIDVVEKKCCANEWDKINYSTVPSNANIKYKNAFLKHDAERRKQFLDALQNGDPNVKINSRVLFPHEIVHKYTGTSWYGNQQICDYDATLEQLWKNLPDYVNGASNILVVRDGSGSMSCQIPGTSTTALDVSTALSVYFAEKATGQYKDKFITFSSQPELINFEGVRSLHDKLQICYAHDDCTNTNIEKTFKLVLDVAVENSLKQEEIPNLLIISDMEFDEAVFGAKHKKLFGHIEAMYAEHGYKLPKLIFWNVNSRTNTIPITSNANGIILVSGYSAVTVKMVLSNELDPYKALKDVLMSERYSRITI